MPNSRKSYPSSLKAKVAVEAIRGQRTTAQIAQIYSIHPALVSVWKRQALEALPGIFQQPRDSRTQPAEAEKEELYKQIGQLKVELDWLKKKLDGSVEEQRRWIECDHPRLSIQRQCQLLGLARSSYYYQPGPESAENLDLLRRLDQLYLDFPYYGSRRFAVVLSEEFRQPINRKRIQRLMRILGVEALYPKPGHTIYPYLLRDLQIVRPNQVWSADITYVPLQRGFLYLVAPTSFSFTDAA